MNVSKPSSLYRSNLWRLGVASSRLPTILTSCAARIAARAYFLLAGRRREIVFENLLPVTSGNTREAKRLAIELFGQFSQKLIDLWRYESGAPIDDLFSRWTGWEHFEAAQKQKRGILLLTPHLGNWEFGAPLLAKRGVKLLVVTLEEPDPQLTAMRKAARERWGIETVAIGEDPFSFVEIIKRLESGSVVALLVDRPQNSSKVDVELFGQSISASVAPTELARATGCILLPVYLPRMADGYAAHVLPPIDYDRASLRPMENRRALVQKIIKAFEPAIREHANQWYHFVPVWTKKD